MHKQEGPSRHRHEPQTSGPDQARTSPSLVLPCPGKAPHTHTCRQRCGHPRPVLSHLAPVNQASESCVLLFSEFPTICWSEVRSLQRGLTLLYSQRMVLRKNTSDSLIAGGHFFNPQFCWLPELNGTKALVPPK